MELFTRIFLTVHIIAGTVSLILFWIPAFTRKGMNVHRLTGRWYVRFMWVVVITAGILSVKNIIIGNYIGAAFLGFLTLVTSSPLLHGISILKSKKSFSPSYIRSYKRFTIAMIVTGLALLIYGGFFVTEGARFLMLFFGMLGVMDIFRWNTIRKMDRTNPDWYKLHYTNMIITGIAAHTAFLAFGGRTLLAQVLAEEWQLLPWIAPTVIGFSVIRVMNWQREKKMRPKLKYT